MFRLIQVAAVLGVTLSLLQVGVNAQGQPLGTSADEELVRKVIVQMTEGFNAHDANASTIMYTADADLVTVRGERFRGTAEFEKGLAAIFATRAREASHRTLNVSVRFIRPDVALAHVTNELSGLIGPEGQRPAPHQELSLRVFVREGQNWRVAAFHNTLIQPFGVPGPQR
jgi:uncharacterized protein (TIGR02246 family)